MPHRTVAFLLLAAAVTACSSDPDTTDAAGGGGPGGGAADGGADGGEGGADGGEGGAGGAGGAAVDPGESLDLFACGIEPDCVQDGGHHGDEMTEESIRCGGELAIAGEGGALLTLGQPGPYPTQTERLVVFGADGAAYEQGRSRCAVEGGCENQNTTEWKRGPLERCVIDVDPAEVEGCGTEEGPCAWYGATKDCVEVGEDWTCGDLPG